MSLILLFNVLLLKIIVLRAYLLVSSDVSAERSKYKTQRVTLLEKERKSSMSSFTRLLAFMLCLICNLSAK